MEADISPIVIGVASGILSTAILFLVKALFQDSVIPWYRGMLYSGISLDGTWYSYSLPVQKIVIEIKQKCELISGKATYVLEEEGNQDIDTIRTFDIMGEIKGKFVILNLYHTDRSRIGVITYLLEIAGDGTKITGQSSGYNPGTEKIASYPISAYRDEIKAKKERGKYKNLSEEKWTNILKSRMIVFPSFIEKHIKEDNTMDEESENSEIEEEVQR